LAPRPLVCLLIADDLTGAADACVKFVLRGFSGIVALSLDAAFDARDRAGVEVLAINADTRRLSEAEARARVRAIPRVEAIALFKKIDSTLRGHVDAEIDEVMQAFGCTRVVFTPAFPAMGRIVRDGRLVVDGRAAGHAAGMRDAASQDDLDAIVAEGMAGGGRPLWVGSAGLAESLAKRLAAPPSHAPRRLSARAGKVMLFIGSPHPVTQAQLARLHAVRADDVVVNPDSKLNTADCERIAGFVMSGGDTAADICRTLGATHLELGGEVEQGVPWGVLRGGVADGVPMVLKSGAFGTPDTLVAAVDFLRNVGHDR
jgi:D-threonate/D-erythronate kinase